MYFYVIWFCIHGFVMYVVFRMCFKFYVLGSHPLFGCEIEMVPAGLRLSPKLLDANPARVIVSVATPKTGEGPRPTGGGTDRNNLYIPYTPCMENMTTLTTPNHPDVGIYGSPMECLGIVVKWPKWAVHSAAVLQEISFCRHCVNNHGGHQQKSLGS